MPWVYDASPQINDDSNYPAIIGVTVAFSTLMLIVVITRGWYRRNMLGWDDRVIFATAVSTLRSHLLPASYARGVIVDPTTVDRDNVCHYVYRPNAMGAWSASREAAQSDSTYIQNRMLPFCLRTAVRVLIEERFSCRTLESPSTR